MKKILVNRLKIKSIEDWRILRKTRKLQDDIFTIKLYLIK
jgi:hypothetical protein